MTILADSFMSRDSIVIRELIGNRVMNVLPVAGRWLDDMDVIDIGKASGFEMGRDGLIKKRFMGSLAGTVRGGQNFNHQAIYGDKTTALGSAPFFLHALQQTGPNPLLSPVPAPWGWTGEMYSFQFTVPLAKAQLQLEVNPANIMNHVAPVFEGCAKNVAHFVSCHFFTDRELDNRLATLGSSSGSRAWSLDNTAKTLTFYPLEGALQRFIPGQELDLIDNSANVRLNERGGIRIPMWVYAVSHATGFVTVQIDPVEDLTAAPWTSIQNNSSELTTSTTTGDYVTWADQTTGQGLTSPYNYNDWIKAGGTGTANKRILGSAAITTTSNDYIDVTLKPFAQSWQQDSVGTLTQSDLALKIDEASLALMQYGHELDTIIMSRGIRHAMYQLDLARSYLTNNRPAVQNNYGYGGGFAIETPNGGTLRGYVSNMVEDGKLLGLKIKNNWKIATVPLPQYAGANSTLSPNEAPARSIPINFKGKGYGFPSDRVPVLNANAEFLDAVHFPAEAVYQMVPEVQIPGMRLTGITTARSLSSPA